MTVDRIRIGVTLAVATLAALAVAVFPASVAAQAADDEYSLNIPGGSSGDGSTSQSSSGTQSPSGTQSSSDPATTAGGDTVPSAPISDDGAATVTELPADSAGGDVAGSGGGGGGGGTKGNGQHAGAGNGQHAGAGNGPNVGSTPANQNAAPTAAVDPAGDSGAPILLIVLAVIAALCTAAAIWRLRKHSGDEPHGIDRDPKGVTGETQSL